MMTTHWPEHLEFYWSIGGVRIDLMITAWARTTKWHVVQQK